jgi:arylsulfatase A-like enzyme
MPRMWSRVTRARRAVLLLSALALLGAAPAGCGGGSGRSGELPRHVVLVTVDTLRADHVGIWGYPRSTTGVRWKPGQSALSIDHLAAQGVVLSRAFAPRGQTLPSIATLMTGRNPLETCALDNRDGLPRSATTLAEVLRSEGWRTAAFSANPVLQPGSGVEQGFEVYGDFGMRKAEDRDALVVGEALRWMRSLRRDEPVFLWLHLIGPHLPYDPAPLGDEEFAGLFTDPGYRGEADGSRAFLDAAYASGADLSDEDVAQVVALYDAEVARIDAVLERFFQEWATPHEAGGSGRWNETLIVFASDHGEELAQRHGYWAHSKSVYSSVLHVPLFFRHPRSLTGQRVFGDLVQLEDVMPTLLDWLRIEGPGGISGRSLLPLFDEEGLSEQAAFGVWRDRIFTVRTSRWRLVWNPDRAVPDDPPAGPYVIPELELFDVLADPLELIDVAEDHPEVVERLLAEIEAWRLRSDVCGEEPVPLAPERREALEHTGYIGEEEGS